MLVGIQGSGKSQISSQLEQQGYIVASNDRSQPIVNIFIRTKCNCFLDKKKNYDVVEIDNITNLRSYNGGKGSIAHASILHNRVTFLSVLRIRIRMFLGLLDPDPLGRDPDPDPSIIKQK